MSSGHEELANRIRDLEQALATTDLEGVDAFVVHTDVGPRVYTLHGADEFYRALVEQMGDGAAAVQTDGTVLYANAAFADLLDLPLESLIGADLAQHVAEEDHDQLAEVLAGGGDRNRQLRLRLLRQGDADVHVLATARRVETATSEPVLCVTVSDRTQQRFYELAQRRADIASDRERVARELHDVVVQTLYAMGLRLQRLAERVPDARAEIDVVLDDVDRTVRQIRDTIFDIRPRRRVDDLRRLLINLVHDATSMLGFQVELVVDGPLDDVPATVHEDIGATLREAVSNVARHAQAEHVTVDIAVNGQFFALRVTDDGVGYTPGRRESGLANIRARAEARGGTSEVTRNRAGGTSLRWRVPVTRS